MSKFLRPFLFLSIVAVSRGQSSTSIHVPHEPVLLQHFVTTAAPFSRSQVELAQSTTVLSGPALWRKQQATLGDTLAGEVGMSATSFGPGASRPVIRGLGGDRIQLLENSVGTIDASSASPDHAVSVEPFLVERVEIVRGPASLLYGSSALGGVVNVITHRIETELPAHRRRGSADVRLGGAADEFARGGQLDVVASHSADSALVAHVDHFRRSAGDVSIPGYAESARLRAVEAAEAAEHGETPPAAARGVLPNSHLASAGAAGGLSWVGHNHHLGVSYSGFDSNYGVPGHTHASAETAGPAVHEGVRIDLRQRRLDAQGEWRNDTAAFTAVRFKFGHASYRHVEHEPDGAAGTVFANRGYDARLEALHGAAKTAWHGALGFQASRNRLAVAGHEAFLPPAQTTRHAVFAFEEYTRHPFAWQFGARVERTLTNADDHAPRRDIEPGASVGAVWELDEGHALAFSIAQTRRAPNAQELFAYGPHAGTASFEIGDALLRTERALGVEISLRRGTGRITGAVTAFAHRFADFVFEKPTGFVAFEEGDAWRFVSQDEDRADADALPVYRTAQVDAVFHGMEVEAVWHLHESSRNQLDVKLAADLTRARAVGGNLPRISPARVMIGIDGTRGRWSAGAEAQFVAAQNRRAPAETASASYTLASAHVSWTRSIPAVDYRVFLRGTNLLNSEARPHTSFVKDLAPLAGRALSIGVRASF